jgi:hypothetical protein
MKITISPLRLSEAVRALSWPRQFALNQDIWTNLVEGSWTKFQ